jgi:diguanylate cyclase (GGDEF)-like protein
VLKRKPQQPNLDNAGEQPEALHAEIGRLKSELTRAQRKIAELEARTDIDPLLDIFNRRGFERELKRSLTYIARYGADAVLIYIDLDGFKAVNDRHGHAAGDALLKRVARALTARVRASDVVARLGGDEFVVLLWNLNEANALARARDLEMLVGEAAIGEGAPRLEVGASAGVARLDSTLTVAQAIDAADRAMYMRKREKHAPRR